MYIAIIETKKDLITIAKQFIAFKIQRGLDNERDEQDFLNAITDGFNSDTLAECYPVCNISQNLLGVLCIIYKPTFVEPPTFAHEAVHIADYFFESLGMNGEDFTEGDEAYAYLVGWVFQCFEDTGKIYVTKKNKNTDGKQEI